MYKPVLQDEVIEDNVTGTSLEATFPDSGYSVGTVRLRGLSLKLVSASTAVLPVANNIFIILLFMCISTIRINTYIQTGVSLASLNEVFIWWYSNTPSSLLGSFNPFTARARFHTTRDLIKWARAHFCTISKIQTLFIFVDAWVGTNSIPSGYLPFQLKKISKKTLPTGYSTTL